MFRLPRRVCSLPRLASQEKSFWEDTSELKKQLRVDWKAWPTESDVELPVAASIKRVEPRSSGKACSCLEKIPTSPADKTNSQFANTGTLIQEIEELFSPAFLAPPSPAGDPPNSLEADDESTCPANNFIRLDSDLDLGSRDAWGWPVFRPKNPHDEDLYGLDLHCCKYKKWRPSADSACVERSIRVDKLSNVQSAMYSDTSSSPDTDEDDWQMQWRREHSSFTSSSSSSIRGRGGCYKIFCGKSPKSEGVGREYLGRQPVATRDRNQCTIRNGLTHHGLTLQPRITTASALEKRLKAVYRSRPTRCCKKYCREGFGHLCSSPYHAYYQACNFDFERVHMLSKCQWGDARRAI